MNIAALVTHEVKFVGGYRNALGADTEKAANVDNHFRSQAGAVNMGHGSDLLIAWPIDRRVIEDVLCEFGGRQRSMIAVVHRFASWLGGIA